MFLDDNILFDLGGTLTDPRQAQHKLRRG